MKKIKKKTFLSLSLFVLPCFTVPDLPLPMVFSVIHIHVKQPHEDFQFNKHPHT